LSAPNRGLHEPTPKNRPCHLPAVLRARTAAAGQPAICPGTHTSAVGLAAQQQFQRVNHDRFARAGLAGDNIKTGREGQIEFVDNGKIADAQFFQHTKPFSSQAANLALIPRPLLPHGEGERPLNDVFAPRPEGEGLG
jgi:hypothetical protein